MNEFERTIDIGRAEEDAPLPAHMRRLGWMAAKTGGRPKTSRYTESPILMSNDISVGSSQQ